MRLIKDIVTVLGTVCIQTYSCPEVSYAIRICVDRSLPCVKWEDTGVRCNVFLVRLINHFLPFYFIPPLIGTTVPSSRLLLSFGLDKRFHRLLVDPETRFSEAKSPRSL